MKIKLQNSGLDTLKRLTLFTRLQKYPEHVFAFHYQKMFNRLSCCASTGHYLYAKSAY